MADVTEESVAGTSSSLPATRSYQLLLLTLAAAGATYARTTLGPLQEAARIALSLSDNQIALLQGPALAVPMVVAAVPIGLLIDRYSRVQLLFLLAGLNLLGTVLTAFASGFVLLFVARCLIGLTAAAITATAVSLLADLYEPVRRGRANMVIVVGQAAGGAAAFALGGALLTWIATAADSWRWAMVWLASPLVLVMVATLAMQEPSRTGTVVRNSSTRQTLAELWRYRAILTPLLVGLVMAEVAFLPVLTWTAPTFMRRFALAPDRVGALMSLVIAVSGVIGPIAGGTLADLAQRSGGPRRTLLVLSGLALLSVPAGLFAVVPGVGLASTLLIVFIALASAVGVIATTLITVVIPNELRGLCISVAAAACVIFGTGLAPLGVSLLSTAMGGAAAIGKALTAVCVIGSLLAVPLFAFGARRFRGSGGPPVRA